jgi:proteasome lid subunit RPN8/RPN11
LFLYESFKKLTADGNEQFFFVTGTEINQTMVLDQWIDLVHERRSLVGVSTDPKVSHRLLIKLEQFGHKLLAHFHSHPGTGSDSTKPSGTDVGFQQRLEGAGHVALMAIFSRDGYVRFLRLDGNVEIKIYGEGVEPHGRNIYRLSRID